MDTQFDNFFWVNEPKQWKKEDDVITIITEPDTDYWSKTHYGFVRFNAPTYLIKTNGDFKFSCKVITDSKILYDQAGIILFQDKENWIKMSNEYHDENYSTLGSVVTNFGYSDWAFVKDEQKRKEIIYQLVKKGQDFTLQYSFDNIEFHIMRVCHLHQEIVESQIGIYACSPQQSSFEAKFTNITLETLE